MEYGITPLYAAQNGHLNVVNLLLERKDIKVNKETTSGFIPLIVASSNGHLGGLKHF